MDPNTSQIKNLSIGDLVTHILYGNEWVGVILRFKQTDDAVQSPRNEKALVQIQPGTKFEDFFKSKASKKDRINDSLGYVTTHWLFKFEVRDAKSRFTWDETSES
ncbi:MAG: hypothetical protein CBD16_10190 [Betaproteobacteria bacterium TMED156]|nr:MAG: hypothetical protein CBD16_10190 [Betaproteobacteria bacterium TMED156]|tara:strand:- start:386 stop:700 length:315 start_codon:yes stop_codon:yes gene_type:complete